MAIGILFLLVPAAAVVAAVVLLVRRKRRAAIIVGAVAAATVVLPMLMIHTQERRSEPPTADAPAAIAIRSPAEMHTSAQADIAFTPPVPRPGVLTIAAPDDFTPWKKTDGLVARRPQAPGEEWVDNAAGAQYIRETIGGIIDFIYWKPGPDNALAGYSGLATSPEEARRAAEDSAVQKVAVLGLRASQEKNRSRPAWNAWSAGDARALAVQLARETQCYSVEGTAAQAAERPYGNLFRAAVRVRVEPQGVETLAQRIAERVQSGYLADQARTRVFVLASVGLIVCIVGFFAAYCFLRAGTAGALA
ncbi:MAG TPA: hypothetical protein DCM87_06800, partial [Planctomycetes bacterium]|nr:hypothetical protein [Planctomycetota bacterium]